MQRVQRIAAGRRGPLRQMNDHITARKRDDAPFSDRFEFFDSLFNGGDDGVGGADQFYIDAQIIVDKHIAMPVASQPVNDGRIAGDGRGKPAVLHGNRCRGWF